MVFGLIADIIWGYVVLTLSCPSDDDRSRQPDSVRRTCQRCDVTQPGVLSAL